MEASIKKLARRIKGKVKRHHSLVGLIIVLVVVLGVVTFLKFQKKPAQQAPPQAVTYSTNHPDESKTNADNYNWTGAPDEPKKLIINKIGVDAYVQHMGVDQNKQIAVPTNTHLTGWFTESAKPGQNGLAIIDGHVSGYTDGGVFKDLKNLQKGDTFEIQLGNGTTLHYKVVSTASPTVAEAANVLFSQDPKVKSQVNLITCVGTYVKDTQSFDHRLIVSGELTN